jgi:predicted enzyme related to lactoylglutathione lyase
MSMSSNPIPAAVLFVRDVKSVSRFYQDVASMTAIHGDEDHEVLETSGFQLVIHAMRGGRPLTRDPAGKLQVLENSNWKLCLPVESIERARTRAAELGGFIESREHEWTARGFRACDGNDPEGNVLQLRQSAG